MSEPHTTRSRTITWIIVSIIVFISGIVVILNISSSYEAIISPINTFWLSFLIGLGGAGVYLALLLMTEKNLAILENDLVNDIYLMAIFFLLSGGFVAAITQTTTGNLTLRSLQGVFMIGFGWQGALTGVASSGTRIKLIEDHQEETEFLSENTKTILKAKDRKIAELTDLIKEMSEELTEKEDE